MELQKFIHCLDSLSRFEPCKNGCKKVVEAAAIKTEEFRN